MIESTGYTRRTPCAAGPVDSSPGADPQTRALARLLVVCVPLAAAVIVLSMVPAAQFPGWQWVSLLLATPVATWGAWPLYRAAWHGLGYGSPPPWTPWSAWVSAHPSAGRCTHCCSAGRA